MLLVKKFFLFVWDSMMLFDAWLIRRLFQPIVDAGVDRWWCRKGKGWLVFNTVALAVVLFMVPVAIDEPLVEMCMSMLVLLVSIVIARFILLQALWFIVFCSPGVRDNSLEVSNEEMAKSILFTSLKTMLFLGILLALFFGLGDIFLTASMIMFLVAVFFEGCEAPRQHRTSSD